MTQESAIGVGSAAGIVLAVALAEPRGHGQGGASGEQEAGQRAPASDD